FSEWFGLLRRTKENKYILPLSLPNRNLFCQPCRISLHSREYLLIMGGETMNTNTVAKKLGVSASTIGRWVRQLNLDVERNEFGHFLFSESDVTVLAKHQEKLQEQIPAP